jgi:hypothetical protein
MYSQNTYHESYARHASMAIARIGSNLRLVLFEIIDSLVDIVSLYLC